MDRGEVMHGDGRGTNVPVCPACGSRYSGYPAVSRKDNKSKICSLCGEKESLEALGLPENQTESILKII